MTEAWKAGGAFVGLSVGLFVGAFEFIWMTCFGGNRHLQRYLPRQSFLWLFGCILVLMSVVASDKIGMTSFKHKMTHLTHKACECSWIFEFGFQKFSQRTYQNRHKRLCVHCGSGWWRLLEQVRERGTQLKETITYTFQCFSRTWHWSEGILAFNSACLRVQPCCCHFVLIWKETSYEQRK